MYGKKNTSKIHLSLIMPAKNEERRISRTLFQYATYINKHRLNTEIIVVVNGSTDQTKDIALKYQQQFPFIKVLNTPYKSGKGGAIALGVAQAKGKFIGFVDADGSYTVTETFELFSKLEQSPNLHGVIASRKLQGSTIDQKTPLKRRLFSFFFHLIVKIFFGLNYKDTQSGLKLFKANVIKSLIAKLVVTTWIFDVNLLLLAKYKNLQIEEIAVKVVNKAGSNLNILSALNKIPGEILTLKAFDLRYQIGVFRSRITKHFAKKPVAKRPNILIFSRRYIKHPESGGAELYLQKVVEYLAKNNNVYIFTSRAANLSDRDVINKVNVIRRGGQITVYIYAFFYYLLYFRKDMQVILDVQTGMPFYTPVYSNLPKVCLIHHFGGKQFFSEMALPMAIFGYILEQFITPLVYRNVKFITVSESTKEELQGKGIAESNIYLAFNAVDAKISKARKSSQPLLSYVGRLKKYKQVNIAIEALTLLKPKYPKLKLVIGGTGDQAEELEKLANKLQVSDSVEFLGYISETEKNDLLKKSTLFLMPSNKEGFGITVLEAGKQSTPTIGFNVAGVKNAIIQNQTGILANSTTEFVNAIDYLLKNPQVRIQMGKSAQKFANTYSWQLTAEKVSLILNAQLNHSLVTDKVYPWDLHFDMSTYSLTK